MNRFAQFDFLRILAMFGVLLNHVFNYGLRIYDDFCVDTSTVQGFLLWTTLELMKLAALPSVNCYILVTGYFLIDKVQLRLKGVWKVWSVTWFYAVGIYLLAVAISIVPFQTSALFEHATPVLSNTYWFVTSYIALMFLAPVIAWVMRRASKRQFQIVLLVGAIVCFQPLLGHIFMDDQQILLFVYLFLIGGYIRLYCDGKPARHSRSLWVYLGVLLLMYAYTLFKNTYKVDNNNYMVYAMAYHGLVLPLSVAFFLLIKNWTIQSPILKKAIFAVAPLTFSVYIIHSHPVVHQLLWTFVNEQVQSLSIIVLPFYCLIVTAVVFVICILIDHVRRLAVRKIKHSIF